MTALLHAALNYYDRGLNVIPIKHKSAKGKEPAMKEWTSVQRVRPPREYVEKLLFNQKDLDGVAVILGPVSDCLYCRDYDNAEGCDEYHAWSLDHRGLASELPTVQTARGFHVYFRCDINPPMRIEDYGLAGELRGEDHYVLLPPSRHPSGADYTWLNPLRDSVPTVDPFAVGLARGTEKAEEAEEAEEAELTEAIGILSLPSLPSPLSLSQLSTQPAKTFVRGTILSETQPMKEGERNACIFKLARKLKACPEFAEAPADVVKDTVRQWHAMALSVIGTKPWDDTWGDFANAWNKVKFPYGFDPFRDIMLTVEAQLAQAAPSGGYECPATLRLILICRELQKLAGSQPFYLSCRKAGELIGVDWRTANRRFAMLVADRVLILVRQGNAYKANRWRYVGP